MAARHTHIADRICFLSFCRLIFSFMLSPALAGSSTVHRSAFLQLLKEVFLLVSIIAMAFFVFNITSRFHSYCFPLNWNVLEAIVQVKPDKLVPKVRFSR